MTPRPDRLTPDHRGGHTGRLPHYGVPIVMPVLPANPAQPVVVQPGEGERIAIGPSTVTLKLDSRDTGGKVGAIEYTVAPRFVAPSVLHWHTKEGWVGVVAAGRVGIRFADRSVEIDAGGLVFVPPDCPFAWFNPTDAPAKVVFLYVPGGFEQYFREASAVAAANPGVAIKDLAPQLGPLWVKYGQEKDG